MSAAILRQQVFLNYLLLSVSRNPFGFLYNSKVIAN